MALCYIPGVHIKPMFNNLASLATSEALQNLIAYIKDTWKMHLSYGPYSWRVFGMPNQQ